MAVSCFVFYFYAYLVLLVFLFKAWCLFTHFNCTLFFVISFPCSLLDSRVDKSLCLTRDLCFIYLFFFYPKHTVLGKNKPKVWRDGEYKSYKCRRKSKRGQKGWDKLTFFLSDSEQRECQNQVTFGIPYKDDWHQLYLHVCGRLGCTYWLCVCTGMIDMVNWKGQLVLVFGRDRRTARGCNLPRVHISGGKENLSKRLEDLAQIEGRGVEVWVKNWDLICKPALCCLYAVYKW